MLRMLFIAMLLVMVGASAHAVPVLEQTAAAGLAAVAVDPATHDGTDPSRRKVQRRCARRSRLGICERWNMPKSAQPTTKPGPVPDTRNTPAKH